MDRLNDLTTLVGRLLLSVLFLVSGLGKIVNREQTLAFIERAGLPAPGPAYWTAVGLEVVGPALLIMGIYARGAAAALAIFSIVTAVVFHANFADPNQLIHFVKNIAITGGLLQIVAHGPGHLVINPGRGTRSEAALVA
jgi:putative oxidoreductase